MSRPFPRKTSTLGPGPRGEARPPRWGVRQTSRVPGTPSPDGETRADARALGAALPTRISAGDVQGRSERCLARGASRRQRVDTSRDAPGPGVASLSPPSRAAAGSPGPPPPGPQRAPRRRARPSPAVVRLQADAAAVADGASVHLETRPAGHGAPPASVSSTPRALGPWRGPQGPQVRRRRDAKGERGSGTEERSSANSANLGGAGGGARTESRRQAPQGRRGGVRTWPTRGSGGPIGGAGGPGAGAVAPAANEDEAGRHLGQSPGNAAAAARLCPATQSGALRPPARVPSERWAPITATGAASALQRPDPCRKCPPSAAPCSRTDSSNLSRKPGNSGARASPKAARLADSAEGSPVTRGAGAAARGALPPGGTPPSRAARAPRAATSHLRTPGCEERRTRPRSRQTVGAQPVPPPSRPRRAERAHSRGGLSALTSRHPLAHSPHLPSSPLIFISESTTSGSCPLRGLCLDSCLRTPRPPRGPASRTPPLSSPHLRLVAVNPRKGNPGTKYF